MKSTAIAPANIAFIKYWGKKDTALRLPANGSISMNVSELTTTTTVEFDASYREDSVSINGNQREKEREKVIAHLDRIRTRAKSSLNARVVSVNTFPAAAGLASSASGFAALTVAASNALALNLSEKELSMFARQGSGSACRSIPDGFVEWLDGTTSETSYAVSLYPSTYWDICDCVVVVDEGEKKVSSAEGHEQVTTSPYWSKRMQEIPERIQTCKTAFQEKNFQMLGEVIEDDCLSMHQVMQTQHPPLFYWNDTTKQLMDAVRQWRAEGIPVYFTIDAGPNVHLICEQPTIFLLEKKLKHINGVKSIIVNTAAPGAHLVDTHLF